MFSSKVGSFKKDSPSKQGEMQTNKPVTLTQQQNARSFIEAGD